MRRLAFVVALLALCARSLGASQAKVLVVDINAVIHPVTVDVLRAAAERAKQQKYDLILIRLNTPGGFLEATRDAVAAIVSSPVPVATFVTPGGSRAASAGFFILQAGDVAAMAPGTNTGAAHPVALYGQADETLMKKIENDAAASLRSLVERRGRNINVAEKTVLESKSFTATEALQEHLIDLIAGSDDDLLRQLDGRVVKRFDGSSATLHVRDAAMTVYETTWPQRFRMATSDPNIALALVLLGLLGVYLEFTTPGVILPGVAGGIALLWGLAALAVLPFTWTGVVLLVLGMALLVAEAKVASHGVLAVGGMCSMVLGALLLIDSPIPELRIHMATAIALCLPFAAITLFLVTLVIRIRHQKVETGGESMIGTTGVACTDLSPAGRVLLRGELWNAVAAAQVPANTRVQVIAMHGLEVTVQPLEPVEASHS